MIAEPVAARPAADGDVRRRLHLAAEGATTLRFEDKALPLAVGTFVAVPPEREHEVAPGASMLRVVLP